MRISDWSSDVCSSDLIELESNGSGGDAQAAYTNAVSYGDKVIDGGVFSLMQNRFGTRSGEAQGNVYWDLFQEGNVDYQDGNTECIWALQIDYEAYRAEDGRSKRTEERRVGKEGVSTGKSRWAPDK